jgi:hypothetical protein
MTMSDRGWMDAERDRLLAEADRRAAANRQAWLEYVDARNSETLSRGHVRPTEREVIGAGAYAIIGALAMFCVVCIWAADKLFTALTAG